MVLHNQLPIYRDSYMLLSEIYQITNKFPRDFKYTLGQDMKRDALALFRDLYGANVSQENRRQHLDAFLTSFELLKIEIRLCVDLKIISLKKLAQLSLIMDSIAKQAAAWRNKNKKTLSKRSIDDTAANTAQVFALDDATQISDVNWPF